MNSFQVAKRYAQAILNLYGAQFVPDDVRAMREISQYLQENKRIIFFLRLTVIPDEIKEQGLCSLCERFQLSIPCKKLVGLLRKHRRLALFPKVIVHLERLYLARQNIVPFDVTSAGTLSDTDRVAVEQFLSQEVQASVVCEYHVDQSLVAGLRAQSRYDLWERSVARQLRNMRRILSQ